METNKIKRFHLTTEKGCWVDADESGNITATSHGTIENGKVTINGTRYMYEKDGEDTLVGWSLDNEGNPQTSGLPFIFKVKPKDIFKTLENYMKGFMRNEMTQKDIDRYTQTIYKIQCEINADLDKAPEIIRKWTEIAETESLRIQFTKGEKKNRHDTVIMAVKHVTYALTDSRPLGGAK